jgi:hypothetical protein
MGTPTSLQAILVAADTFPESAPRFPLEAVGNGVCGDAQKRGSIFARVFRVLGGCFAPYSAAKTSRIVSHSLPERYPCGERVRVSYLRLRCIELCSRQCGLSVRTMGCQRQYILAARRWQWRQQTGVDDRGVVALLAHLFLKQSATK